MNLQSLNLAYSQILWTDLILCPLSKIDILKLILSSNLKPYCPKTSNSKCYTCPC